MILRGLFAHNVTLAAPVKNSKCDYVEYFNINVIAYSHLVK